MPRVVPSQVVTVIDQLFPWAATEAEIQGEKKDVYREHSGRLAGLIALVQQIPQELLVLNDEKYSEFVVSTAVIQDTLPRWHSHDFALDWIAVGLSHLHPVTLIRRALTACPDEFPSSQTNELKFITDQALRENLRIDISTADRAFSNSEWKAATVLAGSVLEALLLWALQQKPNPDISTATKNLTNNKTFTQNPGSNLTNRAWSLHHYIEAGFSDT